MRSQRGYTVALTINTNISSLIVQRNLVAATNSLNKAIDRMTTGYKINHASDNAAGYSIAAKWRIQLSSLDVAADNAATGADMLTTLEDTYSLITSHFQRIRDLTEQASNGTYGSDSLKAIKSEVSARLEEIDRIAVNCEFNGLNLMSGELKDDISLQVGLYSDTNSRISLDSSLFEAADVVTLFTKYTSQGSVSSVDDVAGLCSGYDGTKITGGQEIMLDELDKVIDQISQRSTTLGSARNRIDSAIESIDVQTENLTSSLSISLIFHFYYSHFYFSYTY